MATIKATFSVLAGLAVVAGGVTAFAIVQSRATASEEEAAFENRYRSYLLADEMRQSSDDLTRLGRVYVATGDASYKAQYMDILAIRNGEKPRPEAYHRIYWDFVAGGMAKPRPEGRTVPLLTLMKEQGFSDEEFSQLEEAKKNSDGLVALEVEAMNLVEGKDKRGQPLAQPDRGRAIELVHSKQYHLYKSQIMAPIDRFFELLEKRTQAIIDKAAARSGFWRMVSMVSIAALIIAMLGLAVYVYRVVVRGLLAIEHAAHCLAESDYSVEIGGVTRQDEVGNIARTLVDFRDSLRHAAEVRHQQEAHHAAQEKAARKAEEMRRIADAFENAVEGVVSTMRSATSELQQEASDLTHTADSTRQLSTTVAGASEEASVNVQSVASATNEMTASINEIGRQVQESSRIAGEAVRQAEQTDGRISELSQAASRIGDVVKLITAIAEQTNLLALNATIEAARAGEAGKGFAVVAQEVKALAAQTGKATGEISAQITGMQMATNDSVAAIKEIGGTITRIAEIAASIAAAIEEQGAATTEIARNVDEAARGTAQVAGTITEVSRSASETGEASARVQSSAEKVSGGTAALQHEVEQFLEAVRAA